jgi:hypothetical protein
VQAVMVNHHKRLRFQDGGIRPWRGDGLRLTPHKLRRMRLFWLEFYLTKNLGYRDGKPNIILILISPV